LAPLIADLSEEVVRLLVGGRRLVEPAHFLLDRAEVAQGDGPAPLVAGLPIESLGSMVAPGRQGQAPQLEIGQAETVQGGGFVVLVTHLVQDGPGPCQTVDRFIQPPQLQAGQAEHPRRVRREGLIPLGEHGTRWCGPLLQHGGHLRCQLSDLFRRPFLTVGEVVAQESVDEQVRAATAAQEQPFGHRLEEQAVAPGSDPGSGQLGPHSVVHEIRGPTKGQRGEQPGEQQAEQPPADVDA